MSQELQNNGLKQGPISSQELMQKLANAKKVMNKVDQDDYSPSNSEYINETKKYREPQESDFNFTINPATAPQPYNEEKIRQSNLPDSIKEAFIKNPVPEISLNDKIDMSFIHGAKRLMNEDQTPKGANKSRPVRSSQSSSNIDVDLLVPIIENTIRKVLDEKLTQILNANETKSINENLVLKVGNSLFSGKITNVKDVKKTTRRKK